MSLAADQSHRCRLQCQPDQVQGRGPAFPQDSYNQSVVAAAAAKKLPCISTSIGPNVPELGLGRLSGAD